MNKLVMVAVVSSMLACNTQQQRKSTSNTSTETETQLSSQMMMSQLLVGEDCSMIGQGATYGFLENHLSVEAFANFNTAIDIRKAIRDDVSGVCPYVADLRNIIIEDSILQCEAADEDVELRDLLQEILNSYADEIADAKVEMKSCIQDNDFSQVRADLKQLKQDCDLFKVKEIRAANTVEDKQQLIDEFESVLVGDSCASALDDLTGKY
jgi:HPt (histidine-containing phosphotransfer) domain-containing protein